MYRKKMNMSRKKNLQELDKALKKLRRYSPKTRIATAVGRSPTWISLVIKGKYEDDEILETGWEVVEVCKKLKEEDIKKAKSKARKQLS